MRAIVGLILAVGAIALIRDTRYQGQDFEVFHRAARALLDGRAPYDLARDGGMVFKYPPWILPFFVPFGLLPLDAAKWLWGILEIASLLAICRWCLRQGCSPAVLMGALLGFWGIWAVHAMDGQVMLPVLALALWAGISDSAGVVAVAVWALSAKVFTLWSVPGLPRGRRIRGLFLAGAACFLLSLPACQGFTYERADRLVRNWSEAASSGGTLLQGEKVRGRDNQGVPALVLRALKVPSSDGKADVFASLLCGLLGAVLWSKLSRKSESGIRCAGWLALSAVAHPLAWFHLFVLAFPIAVLALDRSFRARRKPLQIAALFGFFLLACATRKTLGAFGSTLELVSIKSFGTLLCMGVSLRTLPSQHDSRKNLKQI